MLSDDQRRDLLDIARAAIVARVCGGPPPPPASEIHVVDAGGVFVTIHRGHELRGCLGTLDCRNGLAGEVLRCAADAASEDPRFPPVDPSELSAISIEVSVLSALERIDPVDPARICVGRHGLLVEDHGRRGLLLPQVATEWRWSCEEFLNQTCVKAGLDPGAWRNGAAVYRFSADVFGD